MNGERGIGVMDVMEQLRSVSNTLYLGAILAGFIISLIGFAVLYQDWGAAAEEPPGVHLGLGGEKYIVEQDALRTLCLGRDCVPPIDAPRYTSTAAAEAWMADRDPVVSVRLNGTAYAFPLPILRYHHIVNAEMGRERFAVTYSPHSGYAAVFDRTVGNRVVRFGNAGMLYNGNLIMYDDATGTLWSQFLGEAIRGARVPSKLETRPAHIVRWGLWSRTHPVGRVLSPDTGIYNMSRYRDDPYFTYRSSPDAPVDRADWGALQPKDVVYGIEMHGEAAAFRDVTVRDLGVVQDQVGNTPVLLVQDEEEGVVRAFRRSIGRTTLRFEDDDGVLKAANTTWSSDGVALRGALQGMRLEPVEAKRIYWFTWTLFHPDTDVFQPT